MHCPVNSEELETADGHPVGAISWLALDEILFHAAVALSEPRPEENGALWLRTIGWPGGVTFEEDPDRLSQDTLFSQSRAEAIRIHQTDSDIPMTTDVVRTLRVDPTPDILRLLRAMLNPSNVLVRGLYKFLMALELRVHRRFLEEAALSAFISREAAIELLRRKLTIREGRRLRHDDVIAHIESVFPTGEPFAEVLRSDWGARILMTHPSSEYGEFWSPPVDADECYESLYSCVHLYRYLLLDEVWVPTD